MEIAHTSAAKQTKPVRIVYLDQNKWIELARAAKHPTEYPDIRELLEAISHEVGAGRLILPLSFANLYETHKINDPKRRDDLASIQATLSRGLVFRGRHKRLQEEISKVFRNAFGLPPVALEENWFLSDIFFESVAECTDERLGCAISNNLITAIRRNPARFLYDFWVNESDERRPGVSRFSAGSEQLRLRIENRRSLHQAEPLSMRRKIYSALLLIDEIELILGFARKAGIPLTTVGELGGQLLDE